VWRDLDAWTGGILGVPQRHHAVFGGAYLNAVPPPVLLDDLLKVK
jgi:hypothetical protein